MDWLTLLVISVPWASVVVLLIFFLKHPEKAEKWGTIIARTLSYVSFRWEKTAVARDIQADINSFVKDTNSQAKDAILPYGIKVNWVSKTTREAFIRKGKVIVKMQHHSNSARNFLYATIEWTKKAVLPASRQFLDKTVLRAIDFACVNKVLTEKKRHDVRQLFVDEIYEPEAKKGSLLEKYCEVFNKLDGRGVFTGVVLPEFISLGKRLGATMPNEKIRFETIGFMSMLEKLSRKKHGEDVYPSYVSENMKCSIVLIARQETYFLYGLSPYLGYINKCCAQGTHSIYVCGIGSDNISIIKRIKDSYESSKKMTIVAERLLSIRGGRTMVLELEVNPVESGTQTSSVGA
jgi:hypothetical protein